MTNGLIRVTLVTSLISLITILFGPLSAGGAQAANAPATLRYGIDEEANISRLPQEIALREGLFAREGLNVEVVRFTGGFRTRGTPAGNAPSVRDGMRDGTIDMSRQQLPILITETLAGGKYVGVSVTSSNPVYFLAVRPEIKTFADLKGKVLTITNPRDGITVWTRKLMATHGLKNDDVMLKNIAGSEGRFACLKSGECAAASLDQPSIFMGLDAGFHALGISNEIGPRLYQVDIVNPAWAATHRDAVIKYIRGTNAAMRFIQDPKNRDEVLKVTVAFMKESEAHARQMLATIWEPKNRVFDGSAPDMNAVKAAIDLMGEFDALKPPLPAATRFVDDSYAKAAGL